MQSYQAGTQLKRRKIRMSEVYAEQRDGVSVLNLKGRVDASTSGQIHENIMDEIEKGSRSIVIDFSEVNYISSAGLRVLIYASKTLAEKSGTFSLCSLNKNIEKILEISGLLKIFNVHEDIASSIAALKKDNAKL